MTWKTVRKSNIIEIRKTFSVGSNYANVLIVVSESDIIVSMNGKAQMTFVDMDNMAEAINDAELELSIPELKIAVEHESWCKLTRYLDLRGDAETETINCSCKAIEQSKKIIT